MNYFLCKLRFNTPIHIGDSESARSLDTSSMTICADTLFSALCHTALTVDGQKGIERLVEYVRSEHIRFSDLHPYAGDRIFLPKPYIAPYVYRDNTGNTKSRKEMKKIAHLPIDMLDDFLSSLRGKGSFDVERAICSFGEHHVTTKVSIRGNEQSLPYIVGLYIFHKDCGLYLIIGYDTDEVLDYIIRLLHILSFSGIGGKISSGYGKFQLIEEVKLEESVYPDLVRLNQLLRHDTPGKYLLLTSSLPTIEELEEVMEGSSYRVIRRGGFVHSSDNRALFPKKQTQYFFSSGSVFLKKFNGDIYCVSEHFNHPVYRYAKPIFLGIE